MMRALRYIPALLVAALVAFLSLWENSAAIVSFPITNDKVAHMLMYVGLACVAMLCVLWDGHAAWYAYLLVWGIVSFYGGALELLQEYCTTLRTGDWADLLSDMLGAAAGLLPAWAIHRVCRRNNYTK